MCANNLLTDAPAAVLPVYLASRLDLVDLPSRETVTYKLEAACCEGDPSCEDANGLEASSGLDVSDEKCSLLCEERRHIYASAEEADESSELQGQKECHLSDEETENKVCESVYAEIDDSGLPRYTDIFKEPGGGGEEDPFMRATAPPLYDTRAEGTPACEPNDTNVKEVLQGTADILERESQENNGADEGEAAASEDKEYYNVASKPSDTSVREDAVLNLTKDDPAVVSAGSPPSPKSLPQKNSASCDENGDKPSPDQDSKTSPEKKGSVYEQLAQNTDKDTHEYQRLSKDSASKDSSQPDERANRAEKDVCAVNGDSPNVQIAANGHIDSTAEC
ncbi:hypothetical protein BaRGS_00003021 [Batillaria attramentaria]|uniref:Uncharacterized protein n=1 Tax=Batillaria attramentaria TaxID=370345 RepID=A0ABD0M1Y9_9CAEN